MDQILKTIVDLIYSTKSKKRKFESQNKEKVIAADASKGILTKKSTEIERGVNWVTSQRAVILLTKNSIVCGKWILPLNKISEARLIKVKSLFGGGQVLKIETVNGENYQFGMQVNDEWVKQTVMELTVENGNIKTTPFSWFIRLFVATYLIYWLLQKSGIV